MTRILWYGVAPWEGTGYGTQAAAWTRHFASRGHDVAIAACHGIHGRATEWEGIPVYPPPAEGRPDLLLNAHAHVHKAELIILLYDLWTMDARQVRDFPTAAWVASDSHHLSAGDAAFLRASGATPVAISEHTRANLVRAGWPSPLCVPHGIDTGVFRPLPDRAAARFAYQLDPGTFAIGINGNNIDRVRKGYPEQLAAFARFHAKHPDSRLFIHCIADMSPQGSLNLPEIGAELGITDAVHYCDQYTYLAGEYSDQDMASWYCAMDVISNCSYGEGFGLAAVEAQACGTPVILSQGTTGPQLAGPAKWLVRTQPYWNPVHAGWWHAPQVDSIAAAYEKAWSARGSASLRAKCVDWAQRYSVAAVAPRWDAALAKLTGE